jgi:hypothetical protein
MNGVLAALGSGWHMFTTNLQSLLDSVEPYSKELTDVTVAVFTIVLAIATVQLARATNVLADDTRKNARQREIQSAISVAHSLSLNLEKAVRLGRPPTEATTDLLPEAIEALNECESLAIGARIGLYDLAMLNQFAGVSITAQFNRLLPNVQALRSRLRNPHLYSELEWLARQTESRVQKS